MVVLTTATQEADSRLPELENNELLLKPSGVVAPAAQTKEAQKDDHKAMGEKKANDPVSSRVQE